MNATIASQILDDCDHSNRKNSPPENVKQPADLHSVLLLPFVAILVGLMPFVYFGLAGLIGWSVLEYANFAYGAFSDLPVSLRLAISLSPVVPAAILITAFLRPLFSLRTKRTTAFSVSREDEPLLVSFVHRIADTTGAPRPSVIELDCEPRISASFFGGVRNPELRLVIGMPLVCNLSQNSFGGVLARELGSFSHPLIVRLKNFVHDINANFQQMADWKSPGELRLEQIVQHYRDDRDIETWKRWTIVPCLDSIRGLFILVRCILVGFAVATRAICAFLLRHLEYRADASQIALSGSENFSATVRHLARLEAAAAVAQAKIASIAEDNRLSRDYPGLVCHLSNSLPPEPALTVRESLNCSSSWMEFRPSIKERIQAAYRRDDAGIFSPEKPASSLIRDPRSLGEIVTRHWYRTEWDLDANQFELVSNETLNRDSTRRNGQLDKADAFFGGSLNPFRPIFPSRNAIEALADLPVVSTSELPGQFATEAERNRELLDRFDELVEARLSAVEFHQLALAGYSMEPGQAGREEKDPEALHSIVEFLDRQLLQVSMKLGPFENHNLRLIGVAVRNLGNSKERTAQLDTWFHHLAIVGQIYSVVPQLKDLATRLSALVRRRPDSDLSGQCGERFDIHVQVCELLKRIEDYLGSLPYPFDDYGDDATMWDFLTADVGTRNEAIAQSAAMANAVIDRIGEFYIRVMGQLAMDLDQEPGNEDSTLFDRWARLASL